MFWKRPKYRLPRFPGSVAKTFRLLCDELNAEEVTQLGLAVDACLQSVVEKNQDGGVGDLDNAKKLANLSHYLLSRYEEYPPKARRLIVGAVRYFAVDGDPFDDDIFASGLYDDMRIMNHVLEKLGIEDRYLTLR